MDINSINLDYDKETGEYCAIWNLKVMGAGKTMGEVLEELRSAAHFGVDSLINLKTEQYQKEKVTQGE